MDLSQLTRALVGLTPLPFVVVENIESDQPPITYFRQPSGNWSWRHPDYKTFGHVCIAVRGSRKAVELDQLLLELPEHTDQ